MSRESSKCLGDCSKRGIKVEDNQLCDYFDPKRKKNKQNCRNCKHFTPIQLSQPNKKEDQEV